MRYTVYWTYQRKPTSSERIRIVNYIKELLKKYPTIIKVEFKNKVGKEEINFNGIGEGGHETFTFYKNDEAFNFCKTAEKPYDTQVKMALIFMKSVLGNGIEISDDGQAETDPAGWGKVLKEQR